MGDYHKAQEIYDELLADCNSVSTSCPLELKTRVYTQASPEHPDILENLSATSAHLDFDSHGYHTHLNAPPPVDMSATNQSVHIPTEADLESYVPSLPAGWATGGIANAKKAPVTVPSKKADEETKKRKRKHKLPKGASEAKPFNGDVS